jgi:hypothetical protein
MLKSLAGKVGMLKTPATASPADFLPHLTGSRLVQKIFVSLYRAF